MKLWVFKRVHGLELRLYKGILQGYKKNMIVQYRYIHVCTVECCVESPGDQERWLKKHRHESMPGDRVKMWEAACPSGQRFGQFIIWRYFY